MYSKSIIFNQISVSKLTWLRVIIPVYSCPYPDSQKPTIWVTRSHVNSCHITENLFYKVLLSSQDDSW